VRTMVADEFLEVGQQGHARRISLRSASARLNSTRTTSQRSVLQRVCSITRRFRKLRTSCCSGTGRGTLPAASVSGSSRLVGTRRGREGCSTPESEVPHAGEVLKVL